MESYNALRILMITTVFPFPPDNGSKIPTYHRLRWLAERNDVTMLCIHTGDIEPPHLQELKKYCAVHLVSAPQLKKGTGLLVKGKNFLRSLWHGTPYFVLDSVCKEAEIWLGRHADQGCFDIIEAADGDAVKYLKREWKAFKVCILHSISDSSLKRQIAIEKNVIKKAKTLAYRIVWRTYDGRIPERVNLCVTLTKQNEKEILALNPETPAMHCLTNGVDLDYFTFQPPNENPMGVCFVGRMDYAANVDAVLYFYKEVLPLVREVCPEIKFYIVGSSPPDEVRQLAYNKRVEVTGYVKDVRPYLRRAGLAVIPTRFGGGILNKILEALALGVPVVTRTMSIEGLTVKPGEDLLTADTPKDFARSVLRLWDDASLRHELARNGRKYVETNHNWKNIIDRYEKELRNQLKIYRRQQQ
ncbi:MAG TPA: glycosyltransferase family 4 protein [Nitrososphaera sp.]|nr:glycosyltransferase family 4 protein [Nitrososphaera sp.]